MVTTPVAATVEVFLTMTPYRNVSPATTFGPTVCIATDRFPSAAGATTGRDCADAVSSDGVGSEDAAKTLALFVTCTPTATSAFTDVTKSPVHWLPAGIVSTGHCTRVGTTTTHPAGPDTYVVPD